MTIVFNNDYFPTLNIWEHYSHGTQKSSVQIHMFYVTGIQKNSDISIIGCSQYMN